MKILFLTLYPDFVPSSRFRVHQFLPFLKKSGIEFDVCPAITSQLYRKFYCSRNRLKQAYFHLSEIFNRLRKLPKLKKYDLVFLQKGILSVSLGGMERLAFSFNKRIVYDFDDALNLANPQRLPRTFRFLEDQKQTANIMKWSKAVIAGNHFLAEAASCYSKNVHIIPTCVDTEFFRPSHGHKNDDRVNILWSGNRSGNFYVNGLAQSISALGKKFKITFTIQSDSPDFIDFSRFYPAKALFREWSLETELSNFQEADIGLMPMHNTLWERGKCAFKALLYMSVGLPVVASPVGVICDIIKDGESGFFASTQEQWIDKISRLIEDRCLANAFGQKGRSLVEEQFSLKVNAPRLKEVIEEAATK